MTATQERTHHAMKRTVLAALLLTASGASLAKVPPTDHRVVSAHAAFGFDLLHQLANKPGANVFISPSSIATALEMTCNGASGQTKAEMAKTLHLTGMSLDAVNRANKALRAGATRADPKVKIAIANSLWAQRNYRFLPSFIQPVKRYYSAAVENVDFGIPTTNRRINAWVSKATNNKINNLLPQLSALTRLVLVNAVYFHGRWTDQFKRRDTRVQPFTLQDGLVKTVPMMYQTGYYRYLKSDGSQAIRLPYGSGRLAMYVFLPDTKDGLPELLERLSLREWRAWIRGMRPAEIALGLPRFHAEYSNALNEPLKALGMRRPFDQSAADFSGMTGKPDLYVSLVQHKAYVDVNEEGTEAAAATALEMQAMGIPMMLAIDHPFLCAIRDDKTGEILFLGAIYDPA